MHLYPPSRDNDLLQHGLCSFNEVGYADLIGMMPTIRPQSYPTLDKPKGITAQEWIYEPKQALIMTMLQNMTINMHHS